MQHFLHDFWPHLTSLFVLVMEILAAGHAVLYKRDTRATIGWVGLILLTPIVGALLYWMFGINRIHRKAKLMRPARQRRNLPMEHAASPELIENCWPRMAGIFVDWSIWWKMPHCGRCWTAIQSTHSSAATKPTRRCCKRSTVPANRSRCPVTFSITIGWANCFATHCPGPAARC